MNRKGTINSKQQDCQVHIVYFKFLYQSNQSLSLKTNAHMFQNSQRLRFGVSPV